MFIFVQGYFFRAECFRKLMSFTSDPSQKKARSTKAICDYVKSYLLAKDINMLSGAIVLAVDSGVLFILDSKVYC